MPTCRSVAPLMRGAAIALTALASAAAGAQTRPEPAAPPAPDRAPPRAAEAPDSAPAAQGRAAVFGTVRAPSGTPVADAEIVVVGGAAPARGRAGAGAPGVRTGPGGTFRLDSVAPGQYFFRARRLGFEPLYFAATLGRGEGRRIDLELTPLPARLAEVKVRARSGFGRREDARLRDFDWRRRAGWGRFLTRDDLKRYRGMTISQALLYATPFFTCRDNGLRTAWTTGVGGSAFAGTGTGWSTLDRGGCPVQVSIDGQMPLGGEAAVDLPVDQIEAVEVYRDAWTALAFGAGSWGATGSLIVLWTGSEADDR